LKQRGRFRNAIPRVFIGLRTYFVPPATLWVMPRTLARAHRHRPRYTHTLHTRAHSSRWLAGAAYHPLPARAYRPGLTAHPVLARSIPNPPGLSPHTADSASDPLGHGWTHAAWLSPFPTPHSSRLATICHEGPEARGVAQHRQTPTWNPGAHPRGPRANQTCRRGSGDCPGCGSAARLRIGRSNSISGWDWWP
jgi:hypothetical protein